MDTVTAAAAVMECGTMQISRQISSGRLFAGTVTESRESGVTVLIPAGAGHTAHEQDFHIPSWPKICKGDTAGVSVESYGTAVIYRPIFIIGKFESRKL